MNPMKSKYILIKLLGVASIIGVVILYFAVYFIPTVKTINLKKRELKDLNLKIKDFVKVESKFAFSNDEEKRLFKQTEKDLSEKLPVIKSKEDFIQLITQVSNYIQKQAERDGIRNLVINSESREMKVNAGTLSSDPNSFRELAAFTTTRLARLQQFDTGPGMKPDAAKAKTGLFALQEGAACHTLTLSFSGTMRSAMNFVNHLPWGPYYMSEDKIIVSAGPDFPYVILFLKIYYISKNPSGGVGNSQ